MYNLCKFAIILGILMSPSAFLNKVTAQEELLLLELSCFSAADCKQFEDSGVNATCTNGDCICHKDQQQVECQPKASNMNNIVGGLCPCTFPDSECNSDQDICYCKEDYIPSSDKRRCLPKSVALHFNCELNEQCEALNNLAVCRAFGSTCQCRDGFIEASNGDCVATLGENFNCTTDLDCQAQHLNNAVCMTEQKQCACENGYVKSASKPVCLSATNSFYSNCSENMQCIYDMGSGAICSNSKCKCDEKHVVVYKTKRRGRYEVYCEQIVEFGQYCRHDSDCIQHNLPDSEQSLSCYFGECNCKHGYYSIDNGPCTRANAAFKWQQNNYLIIILTAFLALNKFLAFFVRFLC